VGSACSFTSEGGLLIRGISSTGGKGRNEVLSGNPLYSGKRRGVKTEYEEKRIPASSGGEFLPTDSKGRRGGRT